ARIGDRTGAGGALVAPLRLVSVFFGGLRGSSRLLLGLLLVRGAIAHLFELAGRLTLVILAALAIAGRPNGRGCSTRVVALLVVDRRIAVLIATRENAFPGEAVFHEKLVGARLVGLLAGSDPNGDSQAARDKGECDPASTHWNGRLRHARSTRRLRQNARTLARTGPGAPRGSSHICQKNLP